MNPRNFLTIAALLTVAAACDRTPTTAASAGGGPRLLMNQAPVANITLVTKGPAVGYYHYEFDATGSYDPEGGPLTYRWSSNCVYVPNSYTFDYVIDVQGTDTCLMYLRVQDAEGLATFREITVNRYGHITW
jgi:hypothetical protein